MTARVTPLRRRREPRMNLSEFVAEVEWLSSYGMHPEMIARQLGTNLVAAQRRLYRADRRDLAAPFELLSGRMRRAA
ncbi:hypothetical protein MUN78_07090 [Leucobacter allii]|uniref:DUF3263 domain-containing protein n=1 Tax=Leucobacter allii TaxID=2932247 RepID=A0ABY4FQM5_9MICO|nr:hypothetical protein [Leucobacter allii]UOQ58582.1 hypothetical protein MUN78_07090 [Leucobacter allii]